MAIELLNDSHDCSQFDCEEPSLNDYLKSHALRHADQGFGQTYVAVEEDNRVRGYHTISPSSLEREIIPKSVPRLDIGVWLLGRLAVDKQWKKTGLGRDLLLDSLRRARELSDAGGGFAVAVDALNESVKGFYLQYGFIELRDDPLHLFLPMKTIRRLGL